MRTYTEKISIAGALQTDMESAEASIVDVGKSEIETKQPASEFTGTSGACRTQL